MNKEQYLKELFEEVKSSLGESTETTDDLNSGSTPKEVFLERIKPVLVDVNALPDFHSCPDEIVGRNAGAGKAFKVDGYYIPEENAAVIDLVSVDWNDSPDVTKIGKSDIDTYFDLMFAFFERSLNAQFQSRLTSEHARTAAEYIQTNNAAGAINRVRLTLITNRVVNFQRLTSTQDQDGIVVERVIWDLERLKQLAEGVHNRGAIDIDFAKDFSEEDITPVQGLPCVHAQTVWYNDTKMEVYLGVIPGDILADIYRKFGQRLMESNVRAYLQGKGKVNKGILATAVEHPELFVAYNNGICCTAARATSQKRQGELLITSLSNFQIVNGGQTTASLYATQLKKVNGKRPNLSSVKVQFKLVVIDDTEHEDLTKRRASIENADAIIHNVARYSNSQNKISEVDLASNSSFQRTLELLSRTVTAVTETNPRPSRWYYERARGSYATDINGIPAEQNKREFKELYPAAQKLDKLDLGRLENIWRLEPHVVCRGAQSSFAELMKYFGKMTLVVDAEYFKRLVAKKILLKAVDDTLKSCGVGGHRAATSCYVLAWLFKHTAHRIDLDRVWMNQAASPALRSSLKGLVDNAHEFLTTYVAGKNMLSEFAKKTFWDRFAEQQFPLQEELLGELLTDSPPLYNFERLPLGDS